MIPSQCVYSDCVHTIIRQSHYRHVELYDKELDMFFGAKLHV